MLSLEQTKNGCGPAQVSEAQPVAVAAPGKPVSSKGGVAKGGGWFRNASPQILPVGALRNCPSFATHGGYSTSPMRKRGRYAFPSPSASG